MIECVVTGGQSGADLGAWTAAQLEGVATGGYMDLGFRTEDGPRPEYAAVFKAVELGTVSYVDRRRANLEACDCAVIFNKGDKLSRDSSGLLADRKLIDRPILTIHLDHEWSLYPIKADEIAQWIMGATRDINVPVLMIAGNRESLAPGIEQQVERHMRRIIRIMLAR